LKSDPSKALKESAKAESDAEKKTGGYNADERESSLKNMMKKGTSFTERRRNKSP
jgi:hypothetical protein